ncbi:hypothetical protein F5Y16DRAFT_1160 [Xylariaceae sp. FL0255]|nr:hypothetical protein F5Y16DRAFT_1160 [Xylariaceae sp. FL0255]
MKFITTTSVALMLGVGTARPDAVRISPNGVSKREVPQEHSHNEFVTGVNAALDLNNPDQITDAVFGLLGNAAAAEGAGDITNLDCLQQDIADQAFTNGKAANNVTAMTNALIFRALERNTGSVGLASVICNETAVNPEIAAISQHQDPASSGAAATNKAITLALAQQLNSIGADPQLALKAGTFAPGTIGDPTGAGNTCDDANDAVGCIFTQNLLVEDASADEINAAVSSAGGSDTSAANATAASTAASSSAVADDCPTTAASASAAPPTARATATTAGTNVNKFTGTLGSAPVPVISSAGDRPFSVNGDTFVNAGAAIQRACSVQNNACSDAANSGTAGLSVSQCNAQEDQCNAANSATAKRGFAGFRARSTDDVSRRAALDTGSCGSPAISFGIQSDRPGEDAFIATDQNDFNHGSALNIGVIAQFICSQLGSKCQASAATVSDCDSATQAATGLSGQAAADAFNNALGV